MLGLIFWSGAALSWFGAWAWRKITFEEALCGAVVLALMALALQTADIVYDLMDMLH